MSIPIVGSGVGHQLIAQNQIKTNSTTTTTTAHKSF